MFNHIAVVGATGAVGHQFIDLLQRRKFGFQKLSLLASSRSAGREFKINGKTHMVAELGERSFAGVDLAFFSAGASISKQFAPIAVRAGALVIDNSSAFRMDPDVPLVVPEVNPQAARAHQGIIANPNCSTIVMNVTVWPLHKINPVRRIVVSTYQAASGAGAAALQELETQTHMVLHGKPAEAKVFPHPIAFNVFVHNSPVDETGYNTEESKMIHETRKIFGVPDLPITATCIRVPVRRAHSESINLTFERPISPDQVRNALAEAPGVRVVDDSAGGRYPMPIDAEGIDDCLVGHIRQDASQPDGRGIDLFVSGDQIRKGAALNALQIAELLVVGSG